jgi:hypothetical protein
MGTRIVFQYKDTPESQVSSWGEVQSLLKGMGATEIRRMRPPLRTGTAILPKGSDVTSVLAALRRLDGVGEVNVDAWREGL